MLTNRAALWLMGLTIAVAALVGCVPHSLPGATATIQPTGTIIPTATATTADTPTLPPTKTEAPSLTPTPEGVDYSQAFFDPQSEADLSKVMDAPAFDDPTYVAWQEGYLAAVNAKLPTYTGPVLNYRTGIDYSTETLTFNGLRDSSNNNDGNDIGVIASYKFVWGNETHVVKTFVMELSDGSRLPFQVAYSNSDPRNQLGISTPTKKMILAVDYGYKVVPSRPADPFVEAFFASQGLPTDYASLKSVVEGNGSDADKARFSRMPFVLFMFEEP